MGELRTRENCPVVETAHVVGAKWDLIVIRYLLEGPKCFAELKEVVQGISSKSLSATLKQLAVKGIVERQVKTGFPISVVYSLTRKGHDMADIIDAMRQWGNRWLLKPSNKAHPSRKHLESQPLNG
jgi:DNA-binding HxlR family transcriptional regulator